MYADGSLLLSGSFLFKLPSKSYSFKIQVARQTGNGIALSRCREWTVLVEREFLWWEYKLQGSENKLIRIFVGGIGYGVNVIVTIYPYLSF